MNDEIDMAQYERVEQAEVNLQIESNPCEGCVFDGTGLACHRPDALQDCHQDDVEYIFIKKEQP